MGQWYVLTWYADELDWPLHGSNADRMTSPHLCSSSFGDCGVLTRGKPRTTGYRLDWYSKEVKCSGCPSAKTTLTGFERWVTCQRGFPSKEVTFSGLSSGTGLRQSLLASCESMKLASSPESISTPWQWETEGEIRVTIRVRARGIISCASSAHHYPLYYWWALVFNRTGGEEMTRLTAINKQLLTYPYLINVEHSRWIPTTVCGESPELNCVIGHTPPPLSEAHLGPCCFSAWGKVWVSAEVKAWTTYRSPLTPLSCSPRLRLSCQVSNTEGTGELN